MVERGHGTILFTGNTGSIRGSALFQNLAIGKCWLRALAQSMPRELQPKDVHVAHAIIDGAVDSERLRSILADRSLDSFLQADEIAEAYCQLNLRRRGAW
jgi:short-subunit dehydrogenase